MAVNLEDYHWLVSDEAVPWLEVARENLQSGCGSRSETRAGRVDVSLVSRLRRDLSAQRAHLAVEQSELRRRACEKFSQAERMFFTRKGLEQATDESVALCKAQRFALESEIADLCCGIGGDLVALAARGLTVGVDLDPIAALLAETNARVLGFEPPRCTAKVSDACAFPLADFATWHIDPDRRISGRRATRGELFQPPLEIVETLLARNSNAAIKLAPATQATDAWRQVAELEWLGSRGECRQQVAWFGSLARHPGQHAATVVDAAGGARTITGQPVEAVPVAERLGRYLYEPHSAVLAAKLIGAICGAHNLEAVSAGIAYLTGDRLISDSVLSAFEVLDVLPLDRKRLRAYCRDHAIGRLEVKKRGVEVDPQRLRKEVIGDGDGDVAATLIVTLVAGTNRVLFARRALEGAEY